MCALSSNIEKTLSVPGASRKAIYQSDLLYVDLAALMRLKKSASEVINIFGPILASVPMDEPYHQLKIEDNDCFLELTVLLCNFIKFKMRLLSPNGSNEPQARPLCEPWSWDVGEAAI